MSLNFTGIDDWEDWDDLKEEKYEKYEKYEKESDKLEKLNIKLLNQKMVESSDNELTEILFSTDKNANANAPLIDTQIKPIKPIKQIKPIIPFKTKQEYIDYAKNCDQQMCNPTSLYLYEFYRTLLDLNSDKMSTTHILLIIEQLHSIVHKRTIIKTESVKKNSTTKDVLEKYNIKKREQEKEQEQEEADNEFEYNRKFLEFLFF